MSDASVKYCFYKLQANLGKSTHQASAGFLHPLSTPWCPRSHIALDIVKGLQPCEGYTVVLSGTFLLVCPLCAPSETPINGRNGQAPLPTLVAAPRAPQDIVFISSQQFTSQVCGFQCASPPTIIHNPKASLSA